MIEGIIFDMDGVISDTQKLHAKIESDLLKRFGLEISPEEITKKYSGVRTKDFFDDLLKRQNKNYNLEKLMEEKWKEMKRLAREHVDEIPGATNLIKNLYKNSFSLAVASASSLEYVKSIIAALGVSEYFDAVISGDMVLKGKPDPEIFLLAASKIDVIPEKCLVIEDGINGMEAAKSAKMKCIGLVSDKKGIYPTENLVLSLSEITLEYLKNVETKSLR